MRKKNLLNESQIRQFMKYANIDRYTNNFVNENYMYEEDEMDNEMDAPEMDAPEMDAPEMDAPEMDAPEMDSDIAPSGGMISIDNFMAAFEDALEKITGEDVMVDTDANAEMDDAEMGDAEMGDAEMGDAEMDDAEMDDAEMDDEEALLETVTRKVMNRLNRKSRKNKNIDSIVERIMSRIDKGA